jgi:putative phosphoribosyl transferase
MPLLRQGGHHAGRIATACTQIAVGDRGHASLCCVHNAIGLVVFAHANGFSQSSRSNHELARRLRERRLDTLEYELLEPDETDHDAHARNISLLADRLLAVIDALPASHRDHPLGLFGSGNASAAALLAETRQAHRVGAVVSRGGRPDLAGNHLNEVQAPTLLLVGESDEQVLTLNRQAYARLRCDKRIEVVPRATHLFLEAGALDTVATKAADWFCAHLQAKPKSGPASHAR